MIKPLTCLATLFLSLTACSPQADDAAENDQATALQPQPMPSSSVPAAQPSPELAGAEDEARADAGELQDTIPARFHGRWAESRADCDIRGHQQYEIGAGEVGFFESTGVVQNVRADGNHAAATLSEQYGDAPPAEYVFYMALEGADTMRIRYDQNPRFRIIRCP